MRSLTSGCRIKSESPPRNFENHDRSAGLGGSLEQPDDERAEANDPKNASQEISVSGEAIERLMIRQLPTRDSERPVRVKLHVTALWEEHRGQSQPA